MSAQKPAKGSVSDSELVRVQPTSNTPDRRRERRVAVLDIIAPCGWINSNTRAHRMQVAKLTKAWREAGRLAGQGVTPFDGQVHITAHIWKDRSNRYDVLNLWPTLKAAIDGIVEAGVLADDDWKHVIGPDMRHGGKGTPRIVITVEST